MTPTHSSRPSPEVPVPDFCSAAFRDPAAAAEWAVKATELSAIYSRRAKSSALCAQRVSELMTVMAQLLPFSYSSVVQRVLRYPLVSESLDKSGYFVYYLLSPYLTKVYVGATGFLGPRLDITDVVETKRKPVLKPWAKVHVGAAVPGARWVPGWEAGGGRGGGGSR